MISAACIACEPHSDTRRAATSTTEPAAATAPPQAGYVGSPGCAACHPAEHRAWTGSHHYSAMLTPTPEGVLGDFADARFSHAAVESRFFEADGSYFVHTDGADGKLGDFKVAYTFGSEPLQQYLLELPGGRLQAFGIAWDSRPRSAGGQRWFHLHPDARVSHADVLHWSRDGQNWNHMCADCHSTNVRKGYDKATNTYSTSFSEVDVGCEACHGPASAHVRWATTGEGEGALPALASQAAQLNACAPCHSRRSQLAEGFRPDRAYLDHYLPSLLDEGLYHADGQIEAEVYVYGSFLQSRMYALGVVCGNCHEPHSATLRSTGNTLCTQCHSPAGRPGFPALRKAVYDSTEHHFHTPGSSGSRCIACHMPARTYMQVDERRDHSFRIPRPDLSLSLGVPNACNTCHDDRSPRWAAQRIAEHYPERPTDHYATVLYAARRSAPAAEVALGALAGDVSQPAIVRATALSLMADYHRGATALALQQGLNDPEPLVRIGALRGSARWDPQRRWRDGAHLLDDAYKAVRVEAARVLAAAFGALPPAQQSRLGRGIDEYLAAQSQNADRAEAQTNMATVFAATNDQARAEQALTQALRLNPQWVPALVNLADLYRATGRDANGGPLLDRAMQAAPAVPDVLLAKALWLVRQGRADQALPLLARAAELAPHRGRYAYVYAVALNSAGRTGQALSVLDAALRERPDDQQLLQAAAGMARDTGDLARLQSYLQRLQQH